MPKKRQPWPRGLKTQSLAFDNRAFSKSEARSWASSHGFKAPATEEGPTRLWLKQAPKGRFQQGTFRTIQITKGVQAKVALPKKRKK